jgi:AraC-like DNA-binding protein
MSISGFRLFFAFFNPTKIQGIVTNTTMLAHIISIIFLFPLYTCAVLLLPPGNNTKWIQFKDALEKGKSEHVSLTTSADQVIWSFCLKPGCPWPYIGLSMVLPQDSLSYHSYSFTKDDSLIMVLRSNRETPVKMQLATYDPGVTKPDNQISFRMLEHLITVKKEFTRVSIPLGEFKIAPWWLGRFNIPPENNNLYLESICRIEWEFTDPVRMEKIDTLIISRVELKHRSSKSAVLFTIITITIVIGTVILWNITRRKKTTIATIDTFSSVEQLEPKPVVTESGEWERFLLFLQNHYFDAEINLQKVAAELGFSESRLSRLIHEHYPDGFRSLIHDLRIKEARRLLTETELNISEIAFKLGYAAASHFNREFKQRMGTTPSNFRKDGCNLTQNATVI